MTVQQKALEACNQGSQAICDFNPQILFCHLRNGGKNIARTDKENRFLKPSRKHWHWAWYTVVFMRSLYS